MWILSLQLPMPWKTLVHHDIQKILSKNNSQTLENDSLVFMRNQSFRNGDFWTECCWVSLLPRVAVPHLTVGPSIKLPRKSHRQRSLAGYSPWGSRRVGHDLGTEQQNKASNDLSFLPSSFLHFMIMLGKLFNISSTPCITISLWLWVLEPK